MTNLDRAARALVTLVPMIVFGCGFADAPVRPLITPTPTVMAPPAPEEECVYFRGEVNAPGRYLIMAPAHIVEALDAAGGLTPIADPHIIVSRRLIDGRLVRWVVASDDVRAGLAPDPELEPEDIVDAIGLH